MSRCALSPRRRHAIRIVLVLLLGGLLTGVGGASGKQQPSQPQPQVPSFRSGTTVVEVHAIVKDRDRHFVPNLTADDFEIFEDGVPQKISSAYVVTGGRQADVAAQSAGAASKAGAQSSLLDRPVPRLFVFDFDLAHMSVAAVVRAKSAAEKFLATNFKNTDVGGIVVEGRMANARLTSEREELRVAINAIQPSGDTRSKEIDRREWPRILSIYEAYRIDRTDTEVIAQVLTRACKDNPDMCRPDPEIIKEQIAAKARQMVMQARADSVRTLKTLEALVNGLSRLPGRKTVVYLSDGFFGEETWPELREVLGLAARSSVVIYSVDTRGLNKGTAGSSIFEEPPQQRIGSPADPDPFDVGMDAPASLALDSGGMVIRNTNDFERAFGEIADDTSSYYVIGYQASNTNFDGKVRKINVRVKRDGLKVRAWKGYLPARADVTVADRATASVPGAPATPPPAAAPPTPPAAAETRPVSVAAGTGERPPEQPANTYRLRPSGTASESASRLRGASTTSSAPEVTPEISRQIQEGWDAYQRGDTKSVVRLLGNLAGNRNAPAWSHYVLGLAAFAENDIALSRSEWRVVQSQAPEFDRVYFDLADTYLRDKNQSSALDVLRDAEKRWPDSGEVLSAVGVVLASLNRFDEAMEKLTRVAAISPRDPAAHFNIASTAEMRLAAESSRPSPKTSGGDRALAAAEYRKVIELGGSEAGRAREALSRLEPLDLSRVVIRPPRLAARLSQDALGGVPIRLTWSQDSTRLCFGSVPRQLPRVREVSAALRVMTIATARMETVTDAPSWAMSYWAWKSALHAPWWPELQIVIEQKRPDPLNRNAARYDERTNVQAFSFRGEIVGERTGDGSSAGVTFSWSPFATGAIAFTDKRGVLLVVDSNGLKREVPNSRGAILPAWSPDGKYLAFLVEDRGLALMIADIEPMATAATAPVSTPAAGTPTLPSGAAAGLDTSAMRLRPGGTVIPADASGLRDSAGSQSVGQLPPVLAEQARIGWAAYERGDTKAARAALGMAASSAAAPPWVKYVLGWAQFAEGDFSMAAAQWEGVRKAVPDFQPVYFDLADSLLQRKQVRQALDTLIQADKRWPDNANILAAIGVVQTFTGSIDEAIVTFRRVLKIAPNDETAIFNLGGACETKYVMSLRQPKTEDDDRVQALDYYNRVLKMSGPLADAAREGVHRLEPLDVTQLKFSAPAAVASIPNNVVRGVPMRLAWSPDGRQIFAWGIEDPQRFVGGQAVVSVADGGQKVTAEEPNWAHAYWAWKAAQRAPWLPSASIKAETRRTSGMNTGDPGDPNRAYRAATTYTTNLLTLHNEVIAEADRGTVIPGLTFTWSPFAMGALAFVNPQHRLVVIDAKGRKVEVPGVANPLLPAWSEDGRHIAFLERQGSSYALKIVDLISR